MQLLTAQEVVEKELLSDEWAREKLYNIDYTHLDKRKLALYPVKDLSIKEINKSIEDNQYFLFVGTL